MHEDFSVQEMVQVAITAASHKFAWGRAVWLRGEERGLHEMEPEMKPNMEGKQKEINSRHFSRWFEHDLKHS